MKKVKFRGKRIDNGEWIYGYYYEHQPPLQGIVKMIMFLKKLNATL